MRKTIQLRVRLVEERIGMEPFHHAFLDVWLWSEGIEWLLSKNILPRFETSPLPHFARMRLSQLDGVFSVSLPHRGGHLGVARQRREEGGGARSMATAQRAAARASKQGGAASVWGTRLDGSASVRGPRLGGGVSESRAAARLRVLRFGNRDGEERRREGSGLSVWHVGLIANRVN